MRTDLLLIAETSRADGLALSGLPHLGEWACFSSWCRCQPTTSVAATVVHPPRTRTHSAADVVCSPPLSSPHLDLVRLPAVPDVMSSPAVRPQAVPYRDGRCGTAASPSCRSPRSPWTWALAAAAVAISGAAAAVRPAAAHSFLTHPLPAWEAVAGCRVGGTPGFMYNCRGPCPNAGGYGLREGLDEAHPTAVWARGESVEIRWARNNHEGGFVRLALVPLEYRDNPEMHKKYAFHFQCFRSDPFTCKTKAERLIDGWFDEKNVAYKTHVKVPRHIPNGIYVLGWVWYGGLHSDMPWTSYYGDYYSCAYVRIHGGGPLSWSHQPTWWPGRSSLFPNVCETSANKIGQCPEEPCVDRPRELRVPAEFESGAMPPRLWRDMYPAVDNQTDAPAPTPAGELPPDQEELISPVAYLRPTPTPAVKQYDRYVQASSPAADEDDTPADELIDAPDLEFEGEDESGGMQAGGTEAQPVDVYTLERAGAQADSKN